MRVLAAALTMITVIWAGHGVVIAGAQSLDFRRLEISRSHALRLANDPSKPLFAVGISGGFTGAQMVALVYGDGRRDYRLQRRATSTGGI
jgi:hypothetical protein